mmetsp:Transcript_28903/g.92476  ORF Transcript_28903/g.92476 Transcript_28903/m.92476 type:complete len:228 (+) Transcript_28903:1037-1720(+)
MGDLEDGTPPPSRDQSRRARAVRGAGGRASSIFQYFYVDCASSGTVSDDTPRQRHSAQRGGAKPEIHARRGQRESGAGSQRPRSGYAAAVVLVPPDEIWAAAHAAAARGASSSASSSGSASSDALSDAMRSSLCSMPTDSRTNPSVMPTLSRSSASMFACVITAGHVQIDSSAPRFSQSDHGRWIESMSARPAAVPPLTSNQSMPPCRPFMCCRSASSFCGKEASPG